MPAPFLPHLCGYRDGRPNTSDKNDTGSVELGRLFFDAMGISRDAMASDGVGNLMARLLAEDLAKTLSLEAPDLEVHTEKPFTCFEQFSHLRATEELRGDMAVEVERAVADLRRFSQRSPVDPTLMDELGVHLGRIESEVRAAETRRRELLDILGEESVLKLDVTVSRRTPNPRMPEVHLQHLVTGLSLKWTLRTDRAQDCRSQGAKMAALRRGRMPHFASVTMEPRPSMLALLGGGSGDVDCVYHLHLPALTAAVEEYGRATTRRGTPRKDRIRIRDNFRRMCDQRRIRDYDELRSYVATL